MPTFNLVWERTFAEDFGCDRTITTGSGVLVVEARSLAEVEEEIKKYAGCETNYREGVGIRRIEPFAGRGKGESLYAIGKLLDPWGTK